MSGNLATIRALAAVAALLASASAQAVEVQLGLVDELEYHSNLFGEPNRGGQGRTNEPTDVFRSRVGPRVTARDPYGRLTFDLDYTGTFDWYVDEFDINAWENVLLGGAEYALSPRTTLRLEDSFLDLSSIRFTSQALNDGSFVLNGGRTPFQRNSFGASLEHYFTQRFVGSLSVSNDWVDFAQNDDQADSLSMGASANLMYLLSPNDRIGFGATYTYQHFDFGANTRQAESWGRIIDGFLSWSRRFEGDWSISLAGGPGLTESDLANTVRPPLYVTRRGLTPTFTSCTSGRESSCPIAGVVLPPSNASSRIVVAGGQKQDLTFFGQAGLSKRFEMWTVAANYSRRQANAAGDGAASTNDIARLSIEWEPSSRWSAYADAGWSRRTRVGEFISDFLLAPDGSGFATRVGTVTEERKRSNDQVTAAIGARRRLTRALSGTGEIRFRRQWDDLGSNDPNAPSTRVVDFVIVSIRIDYVLDPFRF